MSLLAPSPALAPELEPELERPALAAIAAVITETVRQRALTTSTVATRDLDAAVLGARAALRAVAETRFVVVTVPIAGRASRHGVHDSWLDRAVDTPPLSRLEANRVAVDQNERAGRRADAELYADLGSARGPWPIVGLPRGR